MTNQTIEHVTGPAGRAMIDQSPDDGSYTVTLYDWSYEPVETSGPHMIWDDAFVAACRLSHAD